MVLGQPANWGGFTFSKAPKLRITHFMLLMRSGKTVPCLKRGLNQKRSGAAHSRAGDNKPLYLDHPQFEGFEVRQTVGRGKAA